MPIDYTIPLQQPTNPMGGFDPLRTMSMLSDFHTRKQQQELVALEKNDRARQQSMRDATQRAFQETGGDPTAASRRLRTEGWFEAADGIEKGLLERRKESLGILTTESTLRKDALTQATQLLQGVNNEAGYRAVAPTIRNIIGPVNKELAASIPETYDPEFVKRGVTWGMSAAEAEKYRGEAAATLLADLTNADKAIEAHEAFMKSATTYARTVDSVEGWQEMLDGMKELGAPPATLAMLEPPDMQSGLMPGKTIQGMPAQSGLPGTPDSNRFIAWRDRLIASQEKKAEPAVGEFGDYLTRLAKDLKIPVSDISAPMVEQARKKWFEVSRAPASDAKLTEKQDFLRRGAKQYFDQPLSELNADDYLWLNQQWGNDEISAEQRATIERWRTSQLQQLDSERAKQLFTTSNPQDRAEIEKFYDGQKAAIEQSATYQLGQASPAGRPRPGQMNMGGLTATAPKPSTPAKGGSLKDSFFQIEPPQAPTAPGTMGALWQGGALPAAPQSAPPAPPAAPLVPPMPSAAPPAPPRAPAAAPSQPGRPSAEQVPAPVRTMFERHGNKNGILRAPDGSRWQMYNGAIIPLK